MDGRKEVQEVGIEHPAPMAMLPGIRKDGSFPSESVRHPVLSLFGWVYLVEAVLKQVRKLLLQELQIVVRGFDYAPATEALGDLEGFVFSLDRLCIQDVCQTLKRGL